jgi:ABC-2 type transport system permease protein
VRGALLIAAKDLRERLRDRSALVVALVLPLALAGVFSLVLGDVGDGDVTFKYAVAQLDRGAAGEAFSREVLRPLERRGLIDRREAGSAEEARRLVHDGSAYAAIVVPPGFTAAVSSPRAASLEVAGDVDRPFATLVARSLAESFAAELTAARVAAAAALAAGAPAAEAPRAGRAALALPPAVRVADVSADDRQLDPTTFYAAGMAVFFLFFSVQLGVTSLLDERRDGTLARLLAAPVRRGAVLAGKVATSLAVGLVSMTLLVLATSVVLGAGWGDPLGVALLVVAGVLSATAVAALIAAVAKTAEQAGAWQSMAALVLGMLGGSFFPVAQAGGLIEGLSLLTPHAWFLRGLGDLAGGAGPGAVLPAVGAILAFTAVVGGAAALRARRLVAT